MLTLCVAGASLLVNPKPMELICSAVGIKFIAVGDTSETPQPEAHTLDCSLCQAPTLPQPDSRDVPDLAQPLAHALTPQRAAHIAALAGAPLPPRGPPLHA